MAKLIDCPKCQFNQPEDIFCAHCGVDMQAFIKRSPATQKKLLRFWQVQLVLAVIGLFFVSQLLSVFGVRSSILAPEVEYALSSIDMFSQPRAVTAKSIAALETASNELAAAPENFAPPEIVSDSTAEQESKVRKPANDADNANANAQEMNRTMSVINVSNELLDELQENGFLQTIDERARVAFFDLTQEAHKTWYASLKRSRTIQKSDEIEPTLAALKLLSESPDSAITVNLRKFNSDGVSQPNFTVDYSLGQNVDDITWERPLYLTSDDTVVVFFGIFGGNSVTPPNSNTTAALLIEKK